MKNSYYLQQGKWLRECQSPLIALVNDKKKTSGDSKTDSSTHAGSICRF